MNTLKKILKGIMDRKLKNYEQSRARKCFCPRIGPVRYGA